jgi:hypothetical protein
MLKSLSLVLVQVALVASTAQAYITDSVTTLSKNMGAVDVSEVKFDTGSATLSEDQKTTISDVITKARAQGELKKVKILVWSDKEYPRRQVKYSKDDITLADDRIKELQQYLKDSLNVDKVVAFNMAERPSKMQRFFETKDSEVKNAVENEGDVPTSKEQTGIFGLKGESSKAIIMPFLKK